MHAAQRIVIVGAGYAGLGTALRLARRADRSMRIDLVDGRLEHQLITRLHEVAAGRLTPTGAAIPLGQLLDASGVHLHRAWVEGIDPRRGEVRTTDGDLKYDSLVLAPGSRTDFRDVPGATEHGLPLRTLEDAVRVRGTLAGQVERAVDTRGAERESLLTVLVVGGGYTGVELAAELASRLHELARGSGAFQEEVRIGLIEATNHILPAQPGWMARCAAETLEHMGVQLFLSTPVLGVDADGVVVPAGRIRARTVIWTTGVRAPGWLAESGLPVGSAGRVRVDSHLLTIGHPQIAVLGDAALAHDTSGRQLPATAQVAVQQAEYLADHLIGLTLAGDQPPFVPYVVGEALSLGPDRGLASVGGVPLINRPALLVKRLALARYLDRLGGPRLGLAQLTREYCRVQATHNLLRSAGRGLVGGGYAAR